MSVIHQAYRFALDPTPTQQRALFSHVGGSRFAYNHMLGLVKATLEQREAEKTYDVSGNDLTPYLNTSHYALRKEWNKRKDTVAPWWSENSKECYSDTTKRLSVAMKNFFDSRTGTRRGPAVGFPQFKKRSNSNGSIRFTTGVMRVEADRHHVTLPTLGTIHTHESTRKLTRRIHNGTARILAATVSLHGGRWFVSFTTEVERTVPAGRTTGRVLGVDWGITTLYTGATPEGEHVLSVENPKNVARSAQHLRNVERRLSRKQGPDKRTGQVASRRWLKAQKRVTKTHARTANRRADVIYKTRTYLAKNCDVIVVESLHIPGMVKNRKLAKAIHDAAFGEFKRQLHYKTTWYGSTLIAADKWFPSSKTCSGCGAVKTKLRLSEREYECGVCGMVIDRDVNAAINLARLGVTSPAGSYPEAGRGGMHKPRTPIRVSKAATIETSISKPLVA